MRFIDAVVLAVGVGGMVAAAGFYAFASRECDRAMEALREASRIQAEVDRSLEAQLDTLARVEEWTG